MINKKNKKTDVLKINYFEDLSDKKLILNKEKNKDSNQEDESISDFFIKLNEKEKNDIKNIIITNKDKCLESWINSKEINHFCQKNNISNNEKEYYLGFFGDKVCNLFLDFLNNEYKNSIPFFTTKFFSYIKEKNLEIEDLLKILIYLKNIVIKNAGKNFSSYINFINSIFDEISTKISKEHNNILIKILNEHKNAIDVSNIISKTDVYGVITYANEEFCKLSGYKKEELIGKSHNVIKHPDTKIEVFKNLRETIKSKKIWKGVIKNKNKDGKSYWVKSTIIPILDENDNILEYISIRTDITDQIEANKNIKEYNDALNESNLTLKLDSCGYIIDANPLFCKAFGYKKEELLGKIYITTIGGSLRKNNIDKDRILDIVQVTKDLSYSLLEKILWKNTWKGVIKNKSKTGNIIWCSVTIVPILNSSDNIKEYIVIKTDITDLENAKQHLKKSFDKLKELDSKKDDFLNIASHELRTPMTSIKGYISMILDGDAGEITDETRKYLEQVYVSSDRLVNLINDMLDISKIESGKQKFTEEKIDIRKFLNEVILELKQLFKNKNQDLKINIDFEKFEYNTDGSKLKQVLINILGNANKFTPDFGEIILKSFIENNNLIISIKDSGIGIDKNDISKIFEKFGQVKNSLTRDINGTGLGLPIAKAIIEKMKGILEIESEIGVGSNFIIKLPIK